MKAAICHYSLHRRWKEENWTPDRLAREVKGMGLDAVDFHAGLIGSPTGAVDSMKAALARWGLTLSGLSLSNDFNKESTEELRAQIQKVKDWILVAAEMQSPVSRIFGGGMPKNKRADKKLRDQAMPRIIDALREVADFAEKQGVVLALENHGGLPCTGEEHVEVLKRVNSPALMATVDVGNYLQGGEEGHAGSAIAAPYAAYVHLKDFKKTVNPSAPLGYDLEPCSLGEGDVDHLACLKALKHAGYDGFVALEYEGLEPEMTAVPKSVAYMNEVMAKL